MNFRFVGLFACVLLVLEGGRFLMFILPVCVFTEAGRGHCIPRSWRYRREPPDVGVSV